MAITKKQFEAYVRVQESGVTNMFDVNRVSSLSGLNREQIMTIMKNYGELKEKYAKKPKKKKVNDMLEIPNGGAFDAL